MSWAHVARKDFADAGRSKTLWVVIVLLLLLTVGLTAIPYLVDGSEAQFDEALYYLFSAVGTLIPIIGLLIGYYAVVGERESGSIRFLLGLPNTRGDVLLGKLLGRTGVIVVASVIAFVLGGLLLVALYGDFVATDFLGLLAFTIVMGVVYLAIAIGVSASVSTRGKAIAGVIGAYVIFDILWQIVPTGIYYLAEGEFPEIFGESSLPAWFILLERLSPSQALNAIAVTIVDFIGVADIDLTAANRVAGDVPFYLETWFAGVIVAAWIVVPVAIGYARFNRAVLN